MAGRLSDGFSMREGVLVIGDGDRTAVEVAVELTSRPYRGQIPGFGWLKVLDDLGLYGKGLAELYRQEAGSSIDRLVRILERQRE